MDLTLAIVCFSALSIDNGTQFPSIKMRFLINKINKIIAMRSVIIRSQNQSGAAEKITSAIDLAQRNASEDYAAKRCRSTMVQSAWHFDGTSKWCTAQYWSLNNQPWSNRTYGMKRPTTQDWWVLEWHRRSKPVDSHFYNRNALRFGSSKLRTIGKW